MDGKRLAALLRSSGKRVTPQRTAVAEAVASSKEHPSAEDVYLSVRDKLPSISLATVYKALGELREIGHLRVVPVSGKVRFDADLGQHNHFVCDRCRKVDDIHTPVSRGMPKSADWLAGYEVRGAEMTFRGLCPDCREQNGAREASN